MVSVGVRGCTAQCILDGCDSERCALRVCEAGHFPAQSRGQRRYAPMVFGIIPECRLAPCEFPYRAESHEISSRSFRMDITAE